jgi:hypothetical protein
LLLMVWNRSKGQEVTRRVDFALLTQEFSPVILVALRALLVFLSSC